MVAFPDLFQHLFGMNLLGFGDLVNHYRSRVDVIRRMASEVSMFDRFKGRKDLSRWCCLMASGMSYLGNWLRWVEMAE